MRNILDQLYGGFKLCSAVNSSCVAISYLHRDHDRRAAGMRHPTAVNIFTMTPGNGSYDN
jgi:hypothetical protein